MDKLSLFIINRFKFIGKYIFETRNNKLYINDYELEKIKDYKNKFHSIKISMSLSDFEFLNIEDLFDLTINQELLLNLYESFKKFIDSCSSTQFMNNDYESKNDLITKIGNLIKK